MNTLVSRLRADAAELAELAQRLKVVAASVPDPPPWLIAALAGHAARCTLASTHLAQAARAANRLDREAPRSAVLR
ncbi:hypothetical protein ACIBH1_22885 [Nonomuraea sp. NPDC050663]|uniref:hypothetical protein n=1 Tax=Nonomuraea sp. NPDC050663 TaxID=3364370 RepID=UPI003788AAAD